MFASERIFIPLVFCFPSFSYHSHPPVAPRLWLSAQEIMPSAEIFLVHATSVSFLLQPGKHKICLDHRVSGQPCGLIPIGKSGSADWFVKSWSQWIFVSVIIEVSPRCYQKWVVVLCSKLLNKKAILIVWTHHDASSYALPITRPTGGSCHYDGTQVESECLTFVVRRIGFHLQHVRHSSLRRLSRCYRGNGRPFVMDHGNTLVWRRVVRMRTIILRRVIVFVGGENTFVGEGW